MANIEQLRDWITQEQFSEQLHQEAMAKLDSYSQDPHHELDQQQQQDLLQFLEHATHKEEEVGKTIQALKTDLAPLPEALRDENNKIEIDLNFIEQNSAQQIVKAVTQFRQGVMPEGPTTTQMASEVAPAPAPQPAPEPSPEANPFLPQSSVIMPV